MDKNKEGKGQQNNKVKNLNLDKGQTNKLPKKVIKNKNEDRSNPNSKMNREKSEIRIRRSFKSPRRKIVISKVQEKDVSMNKGKTKGNQSKEPIIPNEIETQKRSEELLKMKKVEKEVKININSDKILKSIKNKNEKVKPLSIKESLKKIKEGKSPKVTKEQMKGKIINNIVNRP